MLAAGLELLLSEGATALTAQRLHQVTGVSRSTIYRHWPSPTAVLSALVHVAPSPARTPTGDPGQDVHDAVDDFCDRLTNKPVGPFLQALVAMAASDLGAAELRQRYLDDLLSPVEGTLSSIGLTGSNLSDAVSAIVAPALVDATLMDRAPDRGAAHRAALRFITPEDPEPTDRR